MSFMPMVGSQVRLTDGRTAWVSSGGPKHGEHDHVIFDDGHQEAVDVMTDIAEIIGEEMPPLVYAFLTGSSRRGELGPGSTANSRPPSRSVVRRQAIQKGEPPKIFYDPLPPEDD